MAFTQRAPGNGTERLLADLRLQWVHRGLLLGPLGSTARKLQRLLTGDLLPRHLLSAMLDQYSVGRPIAGRPWKTPSYGLGLMIGEMTNGELIAGHTGGGPGRAVLLGHQS